MPRARNYVAYLSELWTWLWQSHS